MGNHRRERARYLRITIFHKIHKNKTRPLIKSNMQPWDTGSNSRRSGGSYIPFKYKTIKYNNSQFPYLIKQWNALTKKQESLNLPD